MYVMRLEMPKRKVAIANGKTRYTKTTLIFHFHTSTNISALHVNHLPTYTTSISYVGDGMGYPTNPTENTNKLLPHIYYTIQNSRV